MYFDDEDAEKTLHVKDGKVSVTYVILEHFFCFVIYSRGFVFATNFVLDIGSQVFSEKYLIKGKIYIYIFSKANIVKITKKSFSFCHNFTKL